MRILGTLLAACALAAAACARGSVIEPLPAGGRHVLFVGNSLTYTNDLPSTVAAIAASAGDTVRVAMVAGPDLALIDHATGQSDAFAVIRREHWDVVVLQQGPTPAGLCRDTLILAAKLFDPVVRASGGRTALFMTWPTAAGSSAFFDEVRASFQLAAVAVDGVFLPAGEAWRSAWAIDPTLALYGVDGFHPSAIGTFLAALEIYERISGRDVRTLAPRAFSSGQSLALPEATVRALQQAAHEANATFGGSAARANVLANAPSPC